MTKTTYIKAVLNGIRKGVSELPGDMIVRLVVQPVKHLHTHTHTHLTYYTCTIIIDINLKFTLTVLQTLA